MKQKTTIAENEWKGLIETLLPAAKLVELLPDANDKRSRYELYRWVLLALSDSYDIVTADPNFPLWNSHFLNFPRTSVGVSPDIFYLSTVIEDKGCYRIWGNRGSSNMFSIQFGSALTTVGQEGISRTFDTYEIDDLTLTEKGDFEVMLSPEKPKNWQGDWWPLKPDTGFSFARFLTYDWGTEENGGLHIERLDPSSAKPLRKSADALQQQVEGIVRFALGHASQWVNYIARLRSEGHINQFKMVSMEGIGGWGEQRYWEGVFEIEDDEALLVSVVLPEHVAYWNIQLSSDHWETLDYFNRISSINGLQAKTASDGTFYVVIAKDDPGVANWLDTGGQNSGHVYGRWNKASSAPLPEVKKVKFSKLDRHLPVDVTRVNAEQRIDEMSKRRRSAHRRFRY